MSTCFVVARRAPTGLVRLYNLQDVATDAGRGNRSFVALGRVIAEAASASASTEASGGAAGRYIPYRDSKLTFLLKVGPALLLRCAQLGCLTWPAVSMLHGRHQTRRGQICPLSLKTGV